MKVLLLEDETALKEHIEEYLTLHGYMVETYDNGESLLDNVNLEEIDIFILDVNVPGYDGFEILDYIKKLEIKTPVIFITALTQIEDIKRGFELGCTDYLKKPFELEELVIRIKSFLKKETGNNIYIGSDNKFDMDTKQLFLHNSPIKISKTHKKILYILLKNKGQLVSYDKLIDYVWDGKIVEQNTILSHMRELRKKLPQNCIKNYRGEGYTI